MGYSAWSDDAYSSLRSNYSSKSTNQIFTQTAKGKIMPEMDPKDLTVRESRDSVEHPNSLAIYVSLDETGSMGDIPEYLIKNKLGTLMNTIIDHGVPDPQILFGGVGDHYSDHSPLQVGQFESGNDELDKWLTGIELEANGGGNGGESYGLAYLVAARHTSIDCFEKRGIKGFLFTIGDEPPHLTFEASALQKILGYKEASDLQMADLLEEARRMYHVFHIHVNESSHAHTSLVSRWKNLLGENFLIMEDKDSIAELIATTVALVNGADLDAITSKFSSKTATAVKGALINVKNELVKLTANNSGVVNL